MPETLDLDFGETKPKSNGNLVSSWAARQYIQHVHHETEILICSKNPPQFYERLRYPVLLGSYLLFHVEESNMAKERNNKPCQMLKTRNNQQMCKQLLTCPALRASCEPDKRETTARWAGSSRRSHLLGSSGDLLYCFFFILIF
ncbi:hypothetical protein RRG08_064483 [Elysia crispata]|uniref:Uncharacterized protein n=1 Tax=Elysia crispata TaxID=231223 RepID=A0AAE1DX46_9GAST|nr:hypothetical protein RRG08_064483 [Elysia crispata]